MLGGTQSLHTNGYDEALSLPTGEAATLALRTQQILAFESGVAGVVDPLAGSYYVESLTDRIEQEAAALIEHVDSLGGAAVAIQKGFFQETIAQSAYDLQMAQESGELTVVGVNRFTDKAPPAPVHVPDYSVLEARQQGRLTNVRSRRHAGKAKQAITAIVNAAKGKDSLMPPIVEAVRARVTLGEISEALRATWGTYRA